MTNRHPSEIAAKILTLIPIIPDTQILRDSLEELYEAGKYKAPEQLWELWREGSLILQGCLPGPEELTEQWQVDTVNLWMDREAVKLKG